jgi:hypothetical protein
VVDSDTEDSSLGERNRRAVSRQLFTNDIRPGYDQPLVRPSVFERRGKSRQL